jgi:preprotein translocase subunit SecE
MNKLVAFLKDVKMEMAKVSWPTRNQMVSYTLIVIGLSLALAIFLGALDALFLYLVNTFLVR